ncbi:TonB-dependent receptor [Marinomonas piezotolerans]|uniref:TonB-dependent receptor n=1 Tax=Marinomonas piezotolerans TaxID=2213058 RepID=A0A370UBI2_9GAMM|nr:TonB-dependent receptor [Marinomonas piezotolerans]RDL45166.1 TonB-dependent receptor [Marinomonas piezotolerans]
MTQSLNALPAFAKSAITLSILSSIASIAYADDNETSSTTSFVLPIVVTGTSTPVAASDSLASTTVIDAEEIEKQQPQELTELLAGQPGIDLATNGGYGKTTSVYVRGNDNESTLLMIDGIPLYSASSGGASWGVVSPSLLNRIEILRGPRATLYGAGVSGGVVQAFSEDRYGDPRVVLEAGGGSFNTQILGVTVDGGANGTSYVLALDALKTDGVEIKPDDGNKGLERQSLLAKLKHEFDSGAYVSGVIANSTGHTEYVGDEGDFRVGVVGATLGVPLADLGETKLTLSEARDESDADVRGSHYNTKIQRARWENIFWAGDHEYILGAEISDTSLDGYTGSAVYDVADQRNTAGFAQALFDFYPFSAQLNIRQDDHERYGSSTTGGIALGYALDEAHQLRASYGTAFRVPSFNDLYWPGFGNENLKPGESETVELGINATYSQFFWDAAVYQTEYKNLIDASSTSVSNVAVARMQGVELSSGFDWDQWRVQTALSFLDAKDLDSGKRLRRRAEKSARIDVDRAIENGGLGFSVIGYGERYDDKANTRRLPGYALLNLRAHYEFAEDWEAKFTVKNALDKDYVTTRNFSGWYYQNPGVGAFLTIQYTAL